MVVVSDWLVGRAQRALEREDACTEIGTVLGQDVPGISKYFLHTA